MTKFRLMKLAGLLTESQINEMGESWCTKEILPELYTDGKQTGGSLSTLLF